MVYLNLRKYKLAKTCKNFEIISACITGCDYAKGNWSDCDPDTQTVTRELTLTNEEPDCEDFINQTISCQRYERILAGKERRQERKERRDQNKSKHNFNNFIHFRKASIY